MSRPFRLVSSALVVAASLGVATAAQQPRIANGRVVPQAAGSPLPQSFRSLVSNQADIAWIGYTVPVVDSDRTMCCFNGDNGTWSNGQVIADGRGCCRACRLEPAADGTTMTTRPPVAPASSATNVVRLEPSDRMVVLFRVADRTVERIRVFSEDCELDAGGRTITWLEGVRPESYSLVSFDQFGSDRA